MVLYVNTATSLAIGTEVSTVVRDPIVKDILNHTIRCIYLPLQGGWLVSRSLKAFIVSVFNVCYVLLPCQLFGQNVICLKSQRRLNIESYFMRTYFLITSTSFFQISISVLFGH